MRDFTTKLGLILGASVLFCNASAKNRLIIKYKPMIANSRATNELPVLKKKFDSTVTMNKEMKLLKDSAMVEYVEVDTLLNTQQIEVQAFANDSRYYEQWALGTGDGGIEVSSAWNDTTGSSSIVVAVVDTGIRYHSDISSKILPGADLVSDATYANDGGGRDDDPSDPGDWVSYGDPCYQGRSSNSSWHGTHVAGIIAASTNNNRGMAGVNWNAKIVPVRALGKCGGFTSDIADAIKWAAGISVSGVSNNANPADVINLSLGGAGPCSAYMQDAINQAKSRGAVVVVAAGNSSQNLDTNEFTPANCQGVLVVGSNTQNGYKSSFTNYGKVIDVSAPGGGNGSSVLSLGNTGSTTPGTDSYVYYSGTSMAAPHVAGIVSLMKSVNPSLYPDQLMALVKEAAKSFPWNSGCSEQSCGNGIALAWRSVELALSESADPNFRDEEDVLAGSAPLGSSTLNTTTGSGGLCGSVIYKGEFDSKNSNSDGSGPLSMMVLIILLGISFSGFAKFKIMGDS
ncbi:S8 family peptidase [Halobacteriovorax sp. HLS]|uniref:S8 family peptidase n=1 Tax=Halobacteriovorax sp. HLS TaxID=2234000 RepID=UPI000FD73815|nr:S8 family peptidase [Halobacteriovorax sp. HLS]